MEEKLDTIIDLLQQLVESKKPQYTAWTLEEENCLKAIYNTHNIDSIQEILNEEFNTKRTAGAIESRATKLGLRRNNG